MSRPTPAAIDISVVIHRVRVVIVPGAPDGRSGDQHAGARGPDVERKWSIDGVPSALRAYRLEVP